jgi:Cu(I)/Ag(I) efflux system membrane fusion protein
MKTKVVLIFVLVAAVAGAVLTLAPRNLLAADTKSSGPKILYYTCPMHPSVKANKPGACPICGMNLVPVYDAKGGTNSPLAAVNTNKPAVVPPSCCSMASGGCCQ